MSCRVGRPRCAAAAAWGWAPHAAQSRRIRPGLPSKAPDQGWVGEAWNPHEGGLLRVKVHLRFGVEAPVGVRGKEGAWKPMPTGWYFGRVSMVANDLQSNVYVLHRNGDIDPLVVFDAEGNYLRSWGKGVIDDPHGIRVDRENHVWVVDRAGAILKYTTDGKLLMTIGTKGVRGNDDKSFGSPTDIDWDSQGNIYIADGYGNSRVAKFDKSGKYVMSWGTPGSGPEPVPHGALDSVRLEGSRVCERPREQPHPDFRHQRQAAEDVEPSRLDAGHLDLAEGRDVRPDAPQQRREHHRRHAGRPADEDRSRKREGAGLDGIAGPLGERLAERRHLRRAA